MNRRPSRLLSARDAEKVLGIPASTIRNWHHRRARTGLESAGKDRRGNPMFHEQDLKDLRGGKRTLRNRHGERDTPD